MEIKKTKPNIGAGRRCLKDYINLYILPYEGIDVEWDLEKPPSI